MAFTEWRRSPNLLQTFFTALTQHHPRAAQPPPPFGDDEEQERGLVPARSAQDPFPAEALPDVLPLSAVLRGEMRGEDVS